MRPMLGMKPCAGSSAQSRPSMAWPLMAMSGCASGQQAAPSSAEERAEGLVDEIREEGPEEDEPVVDGPGPAVRREPRDPEAEPEVAEDVHPATRRSRGR